MIKVTQKKFTVSVGLKQFSVRVQPIVKTVSIKQSVIKEGDVLKAEVGDIDPLAHYILARG